MKPHQGLLLACLVLLVHWGVLDRLQAQWSPVPVIKPMTEPVFLRMVTPKPRLTKPPQTSPSRRAVPSNAPTVAPLASDAPVEPEQISPLAPETAQPALESSAPTTVGTEPLPDVPDQPNAAQPNKDEPAPDQWPPDTRVSYRMRGYYRGELYGVAKVQWQRQQERYQVQLDMRMALLFQMSMTSQGLLTQAGLVPQAYEERFLSVRRGVSFESEHLRLQDGRLVSKPVGVQDTASQFVALSHRFSSGQQLLAVGEVASVWLARPGGVDFWTYDVTESVNLQTPELGLVQAFHLKPRPLANPRGDIVAELWLAPSLQYLPVRVRIALGGDNFVDMLVETVEQGSAQPAER